MPIEDVSEQILLDLIKKDCVIYALKSAKQLKREYKELDDHQEFKSLTSQDLVFVWWFACRCSPAAELPEEKRVLVACDKAFTKSKQQAEARKAEYGTLSFPDPIKAAIKVMERFDPGGRISAMADELHLLSQMQHIMRKDISGADMAEVTEWMKAVASARKIRDEILTRIERGGMGVEESGNTLPVNLEGLSSDFMKSQI